MTPSVVGTAATDLQTDIIAYVGELLPVGIGLMALFFGVKLIPKLVKRFAK